jgi:hypothetical protein
VASVDENGRGLPGGKPTSAPRSPRNTNGQSFKKEQKGGRGGSHFNEGRQTDSQGSIGPALEPD